jgi:hypothetical protein
MNANRIRELTLQVNQIRTEHDEQIRTVLQQIERECRRESEACDAIDDIHQAALAEFDLDKDACDFLNSMYEATRVNYVAGLKLLQLRRQANPPWESAAK